GMSGGIAWVLDLEQIRVNAELVELRAVPAEHAEELKALVTAHFEETGSTVAEGLLADWDTALTRFTEVMPRDYRIVLETQAAAEAEGLDDAAVANRIMEVLHG
ncbi:MAG TPA: hypothetical protein VF416_09085, partial [Marmoricola sp.]